MQIETTKIKTVINVEWKNKLTYYARGHFFK